MIIAEQHKRGPKKPGDRRTSITDMGKETVGHARSANPQQSVRKGEDDKQGSEQRAAAPRDTR